MKIFGWMQNKLNGRHGTKQLNSISVNHLHTHQEPRNQEFSDWPHGLLAIGTFGNSNIKEDSNKANSVQENLSQDHLQQLTLEEVEKLHDEVKSLLLNDTESDTAKLALDKLLNGNPSSEDEKDCHLQGSTLTILGTGKGTCLDNTGSAMNKKSLSFLLKKMLVCRGGFTPTPILRDQVPESRMEKILRATFYKKIYPQNPSSTSSTKKYLENKHKPRPVSEDGINHKDDKGSKWVKTDSEYIVLEI
ncbi:hypothetical protein P3X46_007537 [Hevea brasiliensis]|uniref:Uncharacterized protein n=1 Tax=Hevea brasiliensis TaxID=3981 RepID=A0ABQ9MWG7_HEVBR|nr:protein DEEPER ROOTING 1-like isoform X2 [Hevea brasiliensis]KAJ9183725.1 hypothetical protein P3X46_007537 [Hevea brasiliensis]